MAYDSEPSVEVTARDRMIRLRDFLDALPSEKFNMNEWAADSIYKDEVECGTVCCIGGWADMLEHGYLSWHWHETGASLGLSPDQTDDLFTARPSGDDGPWFRYNSITLPMAVGVLDHYLATGEIDWSVAK